MTHGTLLFLKREFHRPKLVDVPLPSAVLVKHRLSLLCRLFGKRFCDVRAEDFVQLSNARACIAVLVSAVKLIIDVDANGMIGFDTNGCLRLNEVNAKVCTTRAVLCGAERGARTAASGAHALLRVLRRRCALSPASVRRRPVDRVTRACGFVRGVDCVHVHRLMLRI